MTTLEIQTPRSLLSLLTPQLREKISALPNELIDRPEHEIISQIRKTIPEWTPSELDFGIRLSFWREYTHAQKHGMQMRIHDIHHGVCSDRYFYRMMDDPNRLAYVLCEFSDEAKKRKLGLSLLWNEMLKIISMEVPINSKTGVPDPKIISIKSDLFKFLYSYEHGMPTQNIRQETKNLNYNVETTQDKLPQTPEEIDERIRQLEARDIESLPLEKEVLLPVQKVISEVGRIEDPKFKR